MLFSILFHILSLTHFLLYQYTTPAFHPLGISPIISAVAHDASPPPQEPFDSSSCHAETSSSSTTSPNTQSRTARPSLLQPVLSLRGPPTAQGSSTSAPALLQLPHISHSHCTASHTAPPCPQAGSAHPPPGQAPLPRRVPERRRSRPHHSPEGRQPQPLRSRRRRSRRPASRRHSPEGPAAPPRRRQSESGLRRHCRRSGRPPTPRVRWHGEGGVEEAGAEKAGRAGGRQLAPRHGVSSERQR